MIGQCNCYGFGLATLALIEIISICYISYLIFFAASGARLFAALYTDQTCCRRYFYVKADIAELWNGLSRQTTRSLSNLSFNIFYFLLKIPWFKQKLKPKTIYLRQFCDPSANLVSKLTRATLLIFLSASAPELWTNTLASIEQFVFCRTAS